ncbi:MAG: hypothetical protein KAI22_01625 [Gammaproteobacteria bacterium]|nr:hypothetical protein [Gammaproteobacteria bacterium]
MKRYFFIFFIIFISINYISYLYFENTSSADSRNYLKSKLNAIESNYRNSTDIIESFAQLIFKNNILTDETYKIIRYLPNASESEQNHIRKKLYDHLLPLYNVLKQDTSLRQIHFHLPDGRSFLRMHRLEKYGDYLFDVRHSIKKVNSKLVYVKGFEEGRIFNAYRYVFPLIINNQHFGSVEISFSINAIIDYMKKNSRSDYCFIIKKIIVDEKVFTDEKNNYQKSILSPWYLHDKSINNEYCTGRIANILGKIKNDKINISKLENSRLFSTAIFEGNKSYIAEFLPIKNTLNRSIAYIFSVNEDTIYPQYKLNFVRNFLLTLIATFSLLSFIFLLLYRNQYIKKKSISLETQVKQRTAQITQLLEKEKRYIRLLDVIKKIDKKIIYNVKLEEVFQFCVNHFTSLPSCIFSIISVNVEGEYLFYSDNCEQFGGNKKLICDKASTLMQIYNTPANTKLVIIDNFSEEQELVNSVDIFEEYQIKKIIIVPLIDNLSAKHYGSLLFFTSRTELFEEHEQQLFTELAKSISSAISIKHNNK